STVSPVKGNESRRCLRRELVAAETAAWPPATALVSVPKEDDMAKDYSPERIATMRDELCDAARELGIPLTKTRAGELVTALLGASARWSADTGTRAGGPFGTFLAGCAADAH